MHKSERTPVFYDILLMLPLLKKELNVFLSSLIGYVIIVAFLAINGLLLWVFHSGFNIFDYGFANIDSLFLLAPWIFLFLIPAITMRSFAEEKRSGTMELLLTKPLQDHVIIGAKFFAGLILVFVSLLPTTVYYITIYQLSTPVGNVDTGAILGSYVGLLFLGAVFVSIGLFCSSITKNQIVAFVLSVLLCSFIYTGFDIIYNFSLFGAADLFVKSLGISYHYASISRGVIDSRDILYFLGMIVLFLLLTKMSVQSRRWHK